MLKNSKIGVFIKVERKVNIYIRNIRMIDMQKSKEIESLKDRVSGLEMEVTIMKRMVGVKMEKKDPKAWKKLQRLGKDISKSWKSDKPSWQIISESRR